MKGAPNFDDFSVYNIILLFCFVFYLWSCMNIESK